MTEQELNRVRELSTRIKAVENHLAELRKHAEDIASKNDGMPRASTIQSKVENLALKIVEDSRELESLSEQIIRATTLLTGQLCQAVTDPQERTVLILRYISCLNFNDICAQLGKSDARVFQLHRAALKKIITD